MPVRVLQSIFIGRPTIAVVGLSPKEHRPSHQVARYLLDVGCTIIPVNPGQDRILGLPCYPDLLSIGKSVDVVDIFRRADQVLSIVHDGVSIGAKVIWMQQGIVNEEAAELARKAGLEVVMDRCLKSDHQWLVSGF